MGIGCFGIQVITTTCYTYAIDCYRVESSEVGSPNFLFMSLNINAHTLQVAQLFNFVRQEVGMTFAFYAIDLAERIGYQFEFVFFACMGSILAFIPIVVLMFKGTEIRERFGTPKNVNVFDQQMVEEHESPTGEEKI